MKFEKHIEIDKQCEDKKAVAVLSDASELTKQAVKSVMLKGGVWLSRNNSVQRVRRADKILKSGDILHMYYDEQVLNKQPDDAILIADEGLYSIWYKPYGMLSQGSKWGDHCTINRWVEKNLLPQRPAFIVHRLDRAAQGLMIIAHQKKTAAYFSKLFELRHIEKRYRAIVCGEFVGHKSFISQIDNKPAVSHARILKYNTATDQSLVEVSIETGRKHQIRRHLSEAGYPIVGDRLYGKIDERNLCLISCYVSFIPPDENETKIYILPDELSFIF